MTSKLDALDAELVAALARDNKRRAAGKDTATKQAARVAAAEAKQAEAAAELYRRELASSGMGDESYRASMRRMGELQRELSALKKRAAQKQTPFMSALIDADIENARLELSVLYGMPILPTDLHENGRFAASVRYHGREVGMMAADTLDVVMEAARLCYVGGDVIETVRFVNGERRESNVPTIGGMYRNLKRAQHMLIDVSRRAIRNGVVPMSLDELAEMGIEPTARMDAWGFDYVDPADIPLGVLLASDDASASRAALAEAKRRAEADKRRAWQEMMEREAAAQSLPANVDSVILRMIVNGATLTQCADKLGVTVGSLSRRLLALEPAGTRWTRTDAGEYGEGVEVIPVAATHTHRAGWSHVGGTYAGPVNVRAIA
jgi:hypothetical protein